MSKKRKSLNTHSQGPWTLRHIAGSNFALQEFELRGAGAYPIFSKDDTAIDGTTFFASPEDAHLIAAAPDLLAMVNKAKQLANIARDWNLDEVEIDGKMVPTLKLVKEFDAAIAKAGGVS